MNDYTLTDEQGLKYTYQASDMRAALAVHHMYHATEIIKAKQDRPKK